MLAVVRIGALCNHLGRLENFTCYLSQFFVFLVISTILKHKAE